LGLAITGPSSERRFMDIYDREGHLITIEKFDELLGDPHYVRVAETDVGPYWVSTVWLGLDHSFGGYPPLIFETMVFVRDEAREDNRRMLFDLDATRYPTEHEARVGHEDVCTLIRATLVEDPFELGEEAHETEHREES
jgi:hypothetical protein